MVMTIWVDAWQHECCGAPFKVAAKVRWTLAVRGVDFLRSLFPAAQPVAITHAEEHHGDVPEHAPITVGLVVSIRAVQLRYERSPETDTRLPVPGSARLTQVDNSDGPETRSAGFAGYIVEVDAG